MIDANKLRPKQPSFDDSDENPHDTEPEGRPMRTPEEAVRLSKPEVGYMELNDLAGGFSCGTCTWAGEDERCVNPLVKAPVSAAHGCCNLFYPANGDPVFPPDARNPRDEG